MDIVVTLPKGNLDHLNEKILAAEEERLVWWDMKREPNQFSSEDKVFIVCAGKLHGYFTVDYTIHNYDYTAAYVAPKISIFRQEYHRIPIDDKIEFRIFFDEWFPVKPIEMRGFQGFRYRKFEWEEKA